MIPSGIDWTRLERRELCPLPSPAAPWRRVVAAVNVWNDRASLEQTLETWAPFVDHAVVVDGRYRGITEREGLSTDGTRELLQETLQGRLELIDAPDLDQVPKRSLYWTRGRVGDLFVLIDADEVYEGLQLLQWAPSLDVGWITYTAPIYGRAQGIPRVFRWRANLRHHLRHHWVVQDLGPELEPRLVSENQLGGAGYDHRLLPGIRFENLRGSGRPSWRVAAAKRHRRAQAEEEARHTAQGGGRRTAGHEPLRILHLAPLDPGFVIYRLSSAINSTSPHSSAFSLLQERPERDDAQGLVAPVQYRHRPDLELVRQLGSSADVFHCHRDPEEYKNLRLDPAGRAVVFHHHGTKYRTAPWKWNRRPADLRLVSNLELLQYAEAGEGAHLDFLPNPVPVARYRKYALARKPAWVKGEPFRVGHSPTRRAKKGTAVFLSTVERLQASGLPVEAVLIENVSHGRALEIKATCHAFFDSFWLGLQCSGLEAGAMGLPVIAGDADVRARYEAWLGELPYTWAGDQRELQEAIEWLYLDREHYLSEAARVGWYVETYHDYAAVVRHYLDLLDGAVDWRRKLSLGGLGDPETRRAGRLVV